MPLVAVFVKIGIQSAKITRFVVAQIRLVVFGWLTKVKVTVPFAFLTTLEISRVVTGAMLVLIWRMVVPEDRE